MIGLTRKARIAVVFLVPISICALGAVIVDTSAVGMCAAIWRHEAINSLIGPRSDRGHPVTWIFPCLHILGFLFVLPGALALHLTLIHFVPWLDPTIYVSPAKPYSRRRSYPKQPAMEVVQVGAAMCRCMGSARSG